MIPALVKNQKIRILLPLPTPLTPRVGEATAPLVAARFHMGVYLLVRAQETLITLETSSWGAHFLRMPIFYLAFFGLAYIDFWLRLWACCLATIGCRSLSRRGAHRRWARERRERGYFLLGEKEKRSHTIDIY